VSSVLEGLISHYADDACHLDVRALIISDVDVIPLTYDAFDAEVLFCISIFSTVRVACRER